jgi:hypothetical protein
MFRRSLTLGAGALALICAAWLPGQAQAQHVRSAARMGMTPQMSRFTPGMTMNRTFMTPRMNSFSPGMNRRFLEPGFSRFGSGMDRRFLEPGFGGFGTGIDRSFLTPGFSGFGGSTAFDRRLLNLQLGGF